MPVIVGTTAGAVEEFPTDLPSRAYLGDSGIALGNSVVDDFGCRWRWTARNAWGNKPAPREQVGDRSYDHGQWDATRYYGPRILSMPGHCIAPSHGDLHRAEQRLRDAVGVGFFQLRITEPGFDSWAMVRQQGEVVWNEINPKVASFSLGLFAPDPRLFSSLERTIGPMSFPTRVGGLVWPATWPTTWTRTSSAGGSDVLYNAGNSPIGLELRVDGPVERMNISLPTLGQTLRLVNPGGDLLTVGQWLTIDTDNRQVRLNGDAGRRSWMTGDWLTIPAATTTEIDISGEGTAPTSTVSGSYRAVRI